MKRLLADENFPGSAIDALAAEGYDILSIARTTPRRVSTTERCYDWRTRRNAGC